jgi:hypothetical protein
MGDGVGLTVGSLVLVWNWSLTACGKRTQPCIDEKINQLFNTNCNKWHFNRFLKDVQQIGSCKLDDLSDALIADAWGSIKSFEERKDSKGKDTFDLSDWWKSNCATLPGFASVLRAVMTITKFTYSWESGTCMKLVIDCMREANSNLHWLID